MVKRKRIALSYTYNENWIGGTYYIENLVSALNTLPDAQKPHIVLITNNKNDSNAAKTKLNYPYISFQLGSGEGNRLFQFVNKVTNRLIRKKLFKQAIKDLDAAFPYYDCIQQSSARKKIYWIADFQEHFAPEFFTQHIIDARKKDQEIIQASSRDLVLSSNDAKQHFETIYPKHKVNVSVLPFAVTHPDYTGLDISSLLTKHKLPAKYFICPNQFWKHKNQLTVIKAVKELKIRGINITVAFTGNTKDDRNPGYYNELKNFVDENGIADNIKFLGFIDRCEQLQLMNNSIAIIQPSLFEGWSTVVEDAKAMNKFLIVSNISIHKEQLPNSTAMFFDPLDATELASCLEKAIKTETISPLFANYDYTVNIEEFGRNFLKIADPDTVTG